MHTYKARDIAIDRARTVAIITMIAANLAPLALPPYPMVFRVISSLAAPLFVALAGMMVALAVIKQSPHAQCSYFVKRGLFLIVIGCLLDIVVLQEMPFSVDVLYLIGFSLPFAYMVARYSIAANIALTLSFIGISEWLRYQFGYTYEPLSIEIAQGLSINSETWQRVFRMWLIEGWFPLFPWMAFILFGVIVAKIRYQKDTITQFDNLRFAGVAVAMSVLGFLGLDFNSLPLERAGYIEIFYPAKVSFIVFAMGVTVFVLCFVDKTGKAALWRFITPLGETSLFVYIAHYVMIAALGYFFAEISPAQYVAVFACLSLSLLICCRVIRALKQTWGTMPMMLKWVLGS